MKIAGELRLADENRVKSLHRNLARVWATRWRESQIVGQFEWETWPTAFVHRSLGRVLFSLLAGMPRICLNSFKESDELKLGDCGSLIWRFGAFDVIAGSGIDAQPVADVDEGGSADLGSRFQLDGFLHIGGSVAFDGRFAVFDLQHNMVGQ